MNKVFGLGLLFLGSMNAAFAGDYVASVNPVVISGDSQGAAAELFNRAMILASQKGIAPQTRQIGEETQTIYRISGIEFISHHYFVDFDSSYSIAFTQAAHADARKDHSGRYVQVYVRSPMSSVLLEILAKTGAEEVALFRDLPEMGTYFQGTTPSLGCQSDLCWISTAGI
jgi:hypothetical protein